ncbi:MAG: ComF family protein [bacterium]|nr:ComF family protein [bacterium]
MDQLKTFIFDLLFPRRCVGCSSWGMVLCAHCRESFRETTRICPACERPSIDGMTHPGCRKSTGIDGLVAAVVYQDAVRAVVHAMKYKWVTMLAPIVSQEMLRRMHAHPLEKLLVSKKGVLIPIPLHKSRERARGFNQSEIIARHLGQLLALQVESDMLTRVQATPPQVARSGKERRAAMHGAFAVPHPDRCKGKTVLLVDDVWTTGSTMREAGRVLKRSGALEVIGLVFARSEGRLV